MKKTLFVVLFFIIGCSTSVDSDYAHGKYVVRCINHVNNCHDKARTLCASGYLVTNRVRPTKIDKDTQYTLNVKCRDKSLY